MYLYPAIAIALPVTGGFVGGLVVRRNLQPWYEGLNHPPWRPPNIFFRISWTIMYILMGYASYLVWQNGGGFSGKAAEPLTLYGIQLVINWAWAFIFFHFHNLKWALIDTLILWIAIVATASKFYEVNETAAYLMIPYLCLTTAAIIINYVIWRDNPSSNE